MTTSDPRLPVIDSIETAIAELSVALAELDRMPVYDKSLVGFAAHAMNNYLSVTEAALDLIERGISASADREVAGWIDGLRHLGSLMQHMVGRLVHAATPAEFPLKFEYVALPVLMERACEHYRTGARQKQLDIVCRPVGEAPAVWADRVAVTVVADNLLSIAVSLSDPGGFILVQILPGPGGVVCAVRNRGAGLTFLEQVRLFEQAATPGAVPPSVQPAVGHGLVIAKELIDRMGGRLWVENEPGAGATFFFRLPYRPAESTETS